MGLLTALYTTHVPFAPQLVGWWMLWCLRIALPAMPVLALTGHIMTRRSIRSR